MTRYDDDGNRYGEHKTWTECVWIDRDFYVHAVADDDETVHAYSVTTRSKRFRPSFRQPGASAVERGRLARLLRRPDYELNPRIKLGKTPFCELGRPQQAAAWIGAHNAHYYESYWGANPGYYQHFIYSVNDSGYGAWDAPWDYDRMHDFSWGFDEAPASPMLTLAEAAVRADALERRSAASSEHSGDVGNGADAELAEENENLEDEPLPSFYDAFRRKAQINTYTVVGPELALDDYPFYTPPPQGYPTTFGVSSGRTRTLAGE